MEEQFYVDRTCLRHMLAQHPEWTVQQYMDATGRSRSWVKKWCHRLRHAPPDDETVLRGRSRARHTPPDPIHPDVVERILDIRDHPPDNLQRVPGPKAILYYLHRDVAMKRTGWHLPTSTSTVWRILDQHDRIVRDRRPEHVPVDRPAPMRDWQMDFKDVSSVPAEPEGKQQHVVETLNVVDVGTSSVVEAVVRDDFTTETTLFALTQTFLAHGLPNKLTCDRDPRFVGSWSGRDFPSPVIRFLLCLGIDVAVCPARRPDLNAFVERYHRNYSEECLDLHRPTNLDAARQVTQAYVAHYNRERPNQAITCDNQPPLVAFPELPVLPKLPHFVDPDRWLQAVHGQRYRRRINSRGSLQLGDHRYYVKQALAGQFVTVVVDATRRELIIEYRLQPIKRIAIKGLYHDLLPFETYLEAMQDEACRDWRRVVRRSRQVTM
jgi:hypothetical protein